MAKEYIEREAAKARLRIWTTDCVLDGDNETADRFRDCIDLLDSIPAADVVEVRHGRWERVIPTKSAAKWSTKVSCSKCHSVGYMRYNYCPNCGAYMMGENNGKCE